MDSAVVIVGAGPVGLMLAGELRLGGVDVVVFEQRRTPSGESRGLGFTARAAEVFDQRGLLDRFGDVDIGRQGHFGGIPMDFGVLDGAYFGVRGIPQYRTEAMLEDWATTLGAQVRRGYEVVGVEQDGDAATVVVDGPQGRVVHRTGYVVGCDGGRSRIRQLAGFDFPGSDATREMFLADVAGAGIRPRFIGERVPEGMVMSAPLGEGVDRIIVCENGRTPREEREAVTFDEVADAWQRLTGESLHGAESRWVSTFTDATRQVTEYRKGRVLLAGDAAHIHLPAGGQGLSLGVQDAANLGWKLAATVDGWAPAGLLDTYHAERHPVGARVLRNTLAQGMLYLSGQHIEPLRTVVAELMEIPTVGRHLAGMVSGLDVRYDVGDHGHHPLLGMRLPNWLLQRPDGTQVQVAQTLHGARGVLVTHDSTSAAAQCVAGWSSHVDLVVGQWVSTEGGGDAPPPESVLVRPDGYVAWATPGAGEAELAAALERWFGPGQPAPVDAATTVAAAS